jgi:hypothetical protein
MVFCSPVVASCFYSLYPALKGFWLIPRDFYDHSGFLDRGAGNNFLRPNFVSDDLDLPEHLLV